MKTVHTVTGPVPAAELGRTLMHEHFLYGYCGYQGDATLGPFREDEAFQICLKAAQTAKSYGIHTVVDATTNECGRDVRFLEKLATAAGINIICSTGFYFEQESAYAYWKFRSAFTNIEDEIAEMMITELTEGIGGTGIKAGVIKLASSYHVITPMEETFFKAAARAQRETGCVIITHTQQGTMGPEQAALLIENGADPGKIAIGHMCGNQDIEYHKRVLSQGVYVNLDRFGLQGELFHTPTDEGRVDLIEKIVASGYEDRILLGHDSVNVQLGRPNIMNPIMQEALKDANIGTLGSKVIPEMRRRGFSDGLIEKFLSANPAKLFS
ncbi:MAG: phosphotriesterase [Oscillospiraceae bacterium]